MNQLSDSIIPIVQAGVLLYQNVPTHKPVELLSVDHFLLQLRGIQINWEHQIHSPIGCVTDPFFDPGSRTVFASIRWMAPYAQHPPCIESYTPSMAFLAEVHPQRGVFCQRPYVAVFHRIIPQHVALCLHPRNPSLRRVSPTSYPHYSTFTPFFC